MLLFCSAVSVVVDSIAPASLPFRPLQNAAPAVTKPKLWFCTLRGAHFCNKTQSACEKVFRSWKTRGFAFVTRGARFCNRGRSLQNCFLQLGPRHAVRVFRPVSKPVMVFLRGAKIKPTKTRVRLQNCCKRLVFFFGEGYFFA